MTKAPLAGVPSTDLELPSRVLAPSECNAYPSAVASPLRVSGRVLAVTGPNFDLADAFGTIRVLGAAGEHTEIRPGDLVLLRGRWNGGAIEEATLIEHTPAPEPKGSGEFARLLWGGVGRRLQQRALATAWVRAYFGKERFLEVDTPLRVQSPGLDFHVDAMEAGERFLVTSPEYHMKRLLVGGVPRLFQLAHCFRADPSGTWHEPEFLMLEWYRAFADVDEVMDDTERIVRGVATALTGRGELSVGNRRIDVSAPFERITVAAAFSEHAGVRDVHALAQSNEAEYFRLLVDRVEPGLAAQGVPVFLHDYPASQASLARLSDSLPRVAERFELYIGGVELSNGFQELTDSAEQRQRLERDQALRRESGKAVYPIDERFLAALEEGMPRASGNALGMDRLLAMICDATAIGDVQAFPETQA